MQTLHHLNPDTVIHALDQFFLAQGSWLKLHCYAANAWGAGKAAACCVARALGVVTARAVTRLHEHFEHTIFDQHISSRCQAFAVDVCCGVGLRVGWVVHQCDARVGNGFAQFVGKEAAALGNIFTVQRA